MSHRLLRLSGTSKSLPIVNSTLSSVRAWTNKLSTSPTEWRSIGSTISSFISSNFGQGNRGELEFAVLGRPDVEELEFIARWSVIDSEVSNKYGTGTHPATMSSETSCSCSRMNRARLFVRSFDCTSDAPPKTKVNDRNCGNNGSTTPVEKPPEAKGRDVISWSTARMDASSTSVKDRKYGAGIRDVQPPPATR